MTAMGGGRRVRIAADTHVVTLDGAHAWLAKKDRPKLVEMLLDQAAGQGANVTAIRKSLDRATRTGRFVDSG